LARGKEGEEYTSGQEKESEGEGRGDRKNVKDKKERKVRVLVWAVRVLDSSGEHGASNGFANSNEKNR
jgi:hypothetical protein